MKTFLELFFYLFHTSEKNRRSALTLSFESRGTLVDFVSDLEVKVQVHTHNQPLAAAAAIQSQSKAYYCRNCRKSGHSESICTQKRKDSAPASQGSDRKSGGYREGHHPSHRTPRPQQQRKAAFCHLHGNCFHDTNNCFKIQQARGELKNNSKSDSKTNISTSQIKSA